MVDHEEVNLYRIPTNWYLHLQLIRCMRSLTSDKVESNFRLVAGKIRMANRIKRSNNSSKPTRKKSSVLKNCKILNEEERLKEITQVTVLNRFLLVLTLFPQMEYCSIGLNSEESSETH